VELIGADYDAIDRAEDRERFRDTMTAAGLRVPRSTIAHTIDDARAALPELGLPFIVRPAFTLGGTGGGVVRSAADVERIVGAGLTASPISQVLLEESVLGWGEFELEVMRDHTDNVVIVCSIENLDPMGVHTGDSVCVAPQQTLTDKQYQALRDQAIAVIRAVGVETGGSNVQFAVNPATDEIVVIEMNPRVSRSSALASKATGFPIAKIAARLAVGYTLQEIPNDITRATPASFEPAIDYCVVKWPRFAFEKFPGAEADLTTHMKSVGEAMALGRTFKQAFAKAMRSRELDIQPVFPADDAELLERVGGASSDRYDHLLEALRRGASVDELRRRTSISPWFLRELAELVAGGWGRADGHGADAHGADGYPFPGVRTFKAVDTCAAEFAARTPYYYSAWERPGADGSPSHEVVRGERPSVVILGSGPNRIGQGIEFDYCCVHAAQTVREQGRDAVMINCNPETVSTDYDTSDRLYFEPLTLEDVLAVCELEQPEGVVVQFGGQTPLKLAAGLAAAGVPILGTSIDAIDLAEDRARFGALLDQLGYSAPPYATATSADEALERAPKVGFPLLVRPSYVLGGRAMEIVYSLDGLKDYLRRVASEPGSTIYLDRFLEDSIEVDVDALCDGGDAAQGGGQVWIAGIMQHVEEAGIHSGDSACVLPPHTLGGDMLARIAAQTTGIARALGVVGLLNVQFAIRGDDRLYVIEANPRASRTVPFVSKAIGVPLAKMACRILLGERIADLELPENTTSGHVCVKEAVLPFNRFAGADSLLGPEMRSTGEVMGIAADFPTAFAKAQAAAGAQLPNQGTVFLTVADSDKPAAIGIASLLHDLGFEIIATRGTAQSLRRMGIPAASINKIGEGSPHVVDCIERGEVDLVINTPVGTGARTDGYEIRSAAIARGIPCITTMSGGLAAARAIISARRGEPGVVSLQELHRSRPVSPASGVAG
jgi:carbamoyl-phosphate synthase large subunit